MAEKKCQIKYKRDLRNDNLSKHSSPLIYIPKGNYFLAQIFLLTRVKRFITPSAKDTFLCCDKRKILPRKRNHNIE